MGITPHTGVYQSQNLSDLPDLASFQSRIWQLVYRRGLRFRFSHVAGGFGGMALGLRLSNNRGNAQKWLWNNLDDSPRNGTWPARCASCANRHVCVDPRQRLCAESVAGGRELDLTITGFLCRPNLGHGNKRKRTLSDIGPTARERQTTNEAAHFINVPLLTQPLPRNWSSNRVEVRLETLTNYAACCGVAEQKNEADRRVVHHPGKKSTSLTGFVDTSVLPVPLRHPPWN